VLIIPIVLLSRWAKRIRGATVNPGFVAKWPLSGHWWSN